MTWFAGNGKFVSESKIASREYQLFLQHVRQGRERKQGVTISASLQLKLTCGTNLWSA